MGVSFDDIIIEKVPQEPWRLHIQISGSDFNSMKDAAHRLARTLLECETQAGFSSVSHWPLGMGAGGGGGGREFVSCHAKIVFDSPLKTKIQELRNEADRLEATLYGGKK